MIRSLAAAVTLALTVASTSLAIRNPPRLLGVGFVLAEVGLAIAIYLFDGYVFDPGHVFATVQSIATRWPLISMATAGVADGPLIAALSGLLMGAAELGGALLDGFEDRGAPEIVSIAASSSFFASAQVWSAGDRAS